MLEHPDYDEHARVVFARDSTTGLDAIIAVHSLALGPALGGVRFRQYPGPDDALGDALRLSKAMSYKNALGGRPFGGGKAVILGSPVTGKSSSLLETFGNEVDRLGGDYIAAEDAGVTPTDIATIRHRTAHVRNIAADRGGPAPYTAYGVFIGIRTAVRQALNRGLRGTTVSVQGLGGVGDDLCRWLSDGGADLIVSDIDADRAEAAARRYGGRVVEPAIAHSVAADVFAPCAFGAGLNSTSIPQIGAPIVAGSANNQLETAEDGARMHARGILYAPDYVINAGGIRATEAPHVPFDHAAAMRRVEGIADTLTTIFDVSTRSDSATSEVADAMARERLASGR
ncbi:amino acid dehydrogenase [Curtobacterium sp. MCBD17_034]|uniref:Glu/Leu/Phe/Val dehydrogenase family protein n=1 Tax=unclassified Curtobacterium TaxID=257496 RepID=UPI000DA97898|nr:MULTISPECIES: Glu/Leu/Phe/Val dehydrogenase dimerization domain-containing protein [unclassified Curtobacterium]PZF62104.1 amino acid dehydrogenase [Curtobacterium sp. MCBD17_034]PZM33962.1 amino acid dehydrogenase [Curtobacterium sp. MCBD17_031]